MITDERDDPEYRNLSQQHYYWGAQAKVDYVCKLTYLSITPQHVRLVAARYDASMKPVDKLPGTILLPEGKQRQPTPNNPVHRWKTPVPGIRNKPKFSRGPDEYVPLKDDIGKILGTFDVKVVFSNNAPLQAALLLETDGRFDVIHNMPTSDKDRFLFKENFNARRKIVEDMADGRYPQLLSIVNLHQPHIPLFSLTHSLIHILLHIVIHSDGCPSLGCVGAKRLLSWQSDKHWLTIKEGLHGLQAVADLQDALTNDFRAPCVFAVGVLPPNRAQQGAMVTIRMRFVSLLPPPPPLLSFSSLSPFSSSDDPLTM